MDENMVDLDMEDDDDMKDMEEDDWQQYNFVTYILYMLNIYFFK